jgi:GNAT superfamily N-acetyltransferase
MKIIETRYTEAIAKEITPLLERHWREIANYQEVIPLAVNFEAYRQADAGGKLLVLVAREGDSMIGYSVFMLIRSPHYRSSLFAMNDVIYVLPEYRKGRTGLALIRESEKLLKARGCVKISWHVKDRNADGTPNPLSAILRKFGYELEEVSLGKLL